MKLADLLQDCPGIARESFPGNLNPALEILAITSDSRKVLSGSLFIAVKGYETDGHQYIQQAFDKGAAAVIAQHRTIDDNRIITVADSRLAMACIAAGFYHHPSKEMTLIGITGTNGKTTTSYLVERIFKEAGYVTGVIGTVNIRFNGTTLNASVTTPDAIDLQHTLHKMKENGVTHVVMEVSSHGLDLHRVDYCDFNACVFTNLTQDHLDFHGNMDDYFNTKKRLFTDFISRPGNPDAAAIINTDDPYGKVLCKELPRDTICISTKKQTRVFACNITDDITGIQADICCDHETFRLHSALTGIFNLENILCAGAAANAVGIDLNCVKKGIEACTKIPGRLEKVGNTINRHLFVDYAHTPDALDSILSMLKRRAPQRLITVFGCGGDRDRAKRPLMAQMACRHSDIAIVTSDNPRTEDPAQIIRDIQAGLNDYALLKDDDLNNDPYTNGYIIEIDRKKAIEKAIHLSKPDDIVIVAGKGHETYQITNSGTIDFDDRQILSAAAQHFSEHFLPQPWSVADIETALNCPPATYPLTDSTVFSGISTDSRTIKTDQVFLALTGENFDGHTFVMDLVNKGIRGFVVSRTYWDKLDSTEQRLFSDLNLTVFVCDDTLNALGKLGRHQRRRTNVKVLAFTGSSGKTTTRKICEKIFQTHYHTLATKGNLNNEIGVPLTLLQLSCRHDWAIIEMGMNHAGEMSELTRIAEPDIAMVLNTAGVHLEGLGTVENVAKAKAEIFEGVRTGGTAIFPAHDERRHILTRGIEQNNDIQTVHSFGPEPDSDLSATDICYNDDSIDFCVVLNGDLTSFRIHSPGRFMVNNCLAAILAARCADINPKGMQKGISAFKPVSGRLNISSLTPDITLIDDAYNANPASVSAALETLSGISRNGTSIAVLGDMLELGNKSADFHRQIGHLVAALKISRLFTFGPDARQIANGALEKGMPADAVSHAATSKEKDMIAQKVLDTATGANWVLIKGSRGMAMETVIQRLHKLVCDRKTGETDEARKN